MNHLDVLAKDPEHDALLLAEAIGWLHDYRKCSDEILSGGGSPRPDLGTHVPSLSGVCLSLPALGLSETIEQLLHGWKGKADDLTASLLLQYISRCHGTAHFDKQEPVDGVPVYPVVQISSPFGHAVDIPANLTCKLWNLPWNALSAYGSTQQRGFRDHVARLFSQTVADTRRPINEVDLWNWGFLVGALYKAALAGALLSGKTLPAHDLRWRLLGIRVSGLEFLLNVIRIPDLIARQQLLSDSLDRVRELLEVAYPLGSEVYRDENGSIYVVPNLPDILKATDRRGISLEALILERFRQGAPARSPAPDVGWEMTPSIELEGTPWWGQDPSRSGNDELPAISDFVSATIRSQPRVRAVERSWRCGKVADICTVCGLRPQGPGRKAADRNVCDVCEERRADRSEEWVSSQTGKTIWTDEVADANGRLALIVGQFDLTHWLDGMLLESLFLVAPCDPQNMTGEPVTSKTPSFSRLRRIWETTRRFWRDVEADTFELLADDRRRLKIHLDAVPNLGPFHVYDLELGATTLSVVWVPPRDGGYLLSADNLGCVARLLGAEAAVYHHPATAAIFVEDCLREEFGTRGRQPVLRNPDTRASASNPNLLAGASISRVQYQQDRYATAIPVVAEPRTLMMLIPADRSLQILREIKEKYEREMGKVRDRLPIHLGAVYANHRTPVRALLDAGRAMLGCGTQQEQWVVRSAARQTQVSDGHFNETAVLELQCGDRRVAWPVPLRMGDGATEDRWYPYVFLETGGDDMKADPANRRAVKASRPMAPGQTEECWLVHAGDLRAGDVVHVSPSTFDFEFLDSTGRRFDIYYDEHGRRPRRTRPFYLEDLDRLDALWASMKRLSSAQRHQVIRTIEATREEWYGAAPGDHAQQDGVFRQFVADTLAGAKWPREKPWNAMQEERDNLIQAGVRGELADLGELHMEILKERDREAH